MATFLGSVSVTVTELLTEHGMKGTPPLDQPDTVCVIYASNMHLANYLQHVNVPCAAIRWMLIHICAETTVEGLDKIFKASVLAGTRVSCTS